MSSDQRRVRYTPEFLDDVDATFERDRSASGRPSRADFHNEDLPLLLQLLADDFDRNTMPSDTPKERVLVRPSKFGGYLLVFARRTDLGSIDIVGLEFDEPPPASYD